jgi:DNA-binding LacI/PurR family transcriptional regulator
MPDKTDFSPRRSWPEAAPKIPKSKSHLRAQERVLEYLQEQFQRLNLPQGSRLPTSRELARQLDVSVSTVQTVFRKLASEGIIRTQVGNGSFLELPPEKATSALRIGISFGLTEETDPSQVWQIGIAGAVLKHCAAMNRQLSVVPVKLNQHDAKETLDGLRGLSGQIQGLIHRASPSLENSTEELSALDFPVVLLNPLSFSATSNFVSTNYAKGGECVARAFLASGRKRVAVLESAGGTRFTIPAALRHAGMVREFGFRRESGFDFQVFQSQGHRENDGYHAASEMFARDGFRPDAIYCAGDFLAAGVLRFCREKKIRIPQEVTLIGGTGAIANNSEFSELTRVGQNIDAIGRELLAMVVELAEGEKSSVPARCIPIAVTVGKTTLPVENEALLQ